MKRLLSLMLTLCLLLGLQCVAFAKEDALLVLDGWRTVDGYRAQYPKRAIQSIGRFDESGESTVRETILSGEWDAAVISTDELSLAELDALGLLLDLKTAPEAAKLAEGLYPRILAGCSVGEKLVALPAGFLSTRAYNYRLLGTNHYGEEDAEAMALRERLGFTQDDQPLTFSDVCRLGLRYMALDAATREGTSFLTSDGALQGYTLLRDMILVYQTEATNEKGEIDFDTLHFHIALAEAEPLLEAFAAAPKRTYGEDDVRPRTVLTTGLGVETYGVYPRVIDGRDIPAFMDVVIVNPNSPHLSDALDFARIANEHARDGREWLLHYENADYDAALRRSYDEDIAAQYREGEDQSVIDELEARKAAGDESHFTPRRVLEHYREQNVSRLSFPRWKSCSYSDAIMEYLAGTLDADGLIERLNEEAKK